MLRLAIPLPSSYHPLAIPCHPLRTPYHPLVTPYHPLPPSYRPLQAACCVKTMAAFGVEMPLSPRRAAATRDALARALYASLFEHVLQQANTSLAPRGGGGGGGGGGAEEDEVGSIGLLDVFGFEVN